MNYKAVIFRRKIEAPGLSRGIEIVDYEFFAKDDSEAERELDNIAKVNKDTLLSARIYREIAGLDHKFITEKQ